MSRTSFVRLATVPLLFAGALGLAACGSSSGAPANQPTTTAAEAMKDGDKMTETTEAMKDGDKMTETTEAMKDGDKMAEPSTTAKP